MKNLRFAFLFLSQYSVNDVGDYIGKPRLIFLSSLKDIFPLLFRERGRERGGERQKHRGEGGALTGNYMHPDWGLNPQPGYVP